MTAVRSPRWRALSLPARENAPAPRQPAHAGGAGALLGMLVAVGAFTAISMLHQPVLPTISDGSYYSHMAEGGGAAAPFIYRVLTPTLAGWLPVSTVWAFWILTAVGVGLASVLLTAMLRPMVGDRLALVGVALYLAGPGAVVIRDPFLVDPLSHAAVAGVYLCVARRRWWPLVPLVAIAALNHDSILFLAPALALVAWQRRTWTPVAAIVAGAAVWVALRLSITAYASHTVLDPGHWAGIIERASRRSWGNPALAAVLDPLRGLGPALLLAPFGWRRAPDWLRAFALTAPLCLLAWLMASDWHRTVMPLYPLVVGSAVIGLSRIRRTPRP